MYIICIPLWSNVVEQRWNSGSAFFYLHICKIVIYIKHCTNKLKQSFGIFFISMKGYTIIPFHLDINKKECFIKVREHKLSDIIIIQSELTVYHKVLWKTRAMTNNAPVFIACIPTFLDNIFLA